MRTALWVYVHWSESSLFKEKELLSFVEFEKTAALAAHAVGLDCGYDKTKIQVLFSDGQDYEARLDLCPKEDTGFAAHCATLLEWIDSDRFVKTYGKDSGIVAQSQVLKDWLLEVVW